jgi:hypothetical protein
VPSLWLRLDESSVEDYKGLYEKFSEDVMEVFDFETSVDKGINWWAKPQHAG